MTSMDQIHRIRDLYFGQDKSLTEIVSIENIDWRHVRKYVDMEDFSEKPPKKPVTLVVGGSQNRWQEGRILENILKI